MDEKNNIMILPVIALRGLVAFPKSSLHFEAARKKSIAAIDEASKKERYIFVSLQKDITVSEPSVDSISEIGTVAKIKQVLKMQGETVKILIEGICRARVISPIRNHPFLEAQVEIIEDIPLNDTVKEEALIRGIQDVFEDYASLLNNVPPEIVMTVLSSGYLPKLCDFIAANMPFKYADKQKILETLEPSLRAETLIKIISLETEIVSAEQSIHSRVYEQMNENQRDYYLREQIKAIKSELGEFDEDDETELKTKILDKKMPKEWEEKLLKEADKLSKMPFGSHEGTVISNYIDVCLTLPFGKMSKENRNIVSAEKILEKDHYGLKKVKERILEYIAAQMLSDNVKGQILCLVGPPGIGKTSIAASIAKAMGRKYNRLSLGGIHDEAEIRGHRKTYVGSMPGRIINAVIRTETMNPVILLDEIDKLASDYKGDPASALLEVLDPEQNVSFRDHFIELPFDLSNVTFITTANTSESIPLPLLDRMEIIELPSYTHNEKFEIAKRHLIPKQLKKHNLKKSQLVITDDVLHTVIEGYTKEAGVRGLEREITKICRKSARAVLEGKKKITVNTGNLSDFLGGIKYRRDSFVGKSKIGVATGLAYTSVGGETLPIEVSVMEGTGKIELTGSLGDVMKESCKAAVTYIRSRAQELSIPADFYKTRDIHIHVPEGATPKDGPSAGITIATAVASELTGKAVRGDVAMTGEITLRGRVLAIGGLREKSMAAFKEGITTVIIPEDNKSDIEELEDIIKENITFIPVSSAEQVLEIALTKDEFENKLFISNENIGRNDRIMS